MPSLAATFNYIAFGWRKVYSIRNLWDFCTFSFNFYTPYIVFVRRRCRKRIFYRHSRSQREHTLPILPWSYFRHLHAMKKEIWFKISHQTYCSPMESVQPFTHAHTHITSSIRSHTCAIPSEKCTQWWAINRKILKRTTNKCVMAFSETRINALNDFFTRLYNCKNSNKSK